VFAQIPTCQGDPGPSEPCWRRGFVNWKHLSAYRPQLWVGRHDLQCFREVARLKEIIVVNINQNVGATFFKAAAPGMGEPETGFNNNPRNVWDSEVSTLLEGHGAGVIDNYKLPAIASGQGGLPRQSIQGPVQDVCARIVRAQKNGDGSLQNY
jgi:hypothetical protein